MEGSESSGSSRDTQAGQVKTRDVLIREYVQQARKKLEAVISPEPNGNGFTFQTQGQLRPAERGQSFEPSSPRDLTSPVRQDETRRPSPQRRLSPQRGASPRREPSPQRGPSPGHLPSTHLDPPQDLSSKLGHGPRQSQESILTIDSGLWPVPGSPVPPVPPIPTDQAFLLSKPPANIPVLSPINSRPRDTLKSQYSMSVYSERPERYSEEASRRASSAVLRDSPKQSSNEWLSSSYKDTQNAQKPNPFVDTIPEEAEILSSEGNPSETSSSARSSSLSSSAPYDLDKILSFQQQSIEDHPQLVRQASLGRKHTATLTMIPPTNAPPMPQGDGKERAEDEKVMSNVSLVPRPLSPRPKLQSPARSFEYLMYENSKSDLASRSGSPGPSGSRPSDRNLQGARLPSDTTRASSLKDRVGSKKPSSITLEPVPPIDKNIDRTKSVTSLYGLIHRAMKLASNLETGKTSSRNNDWFEDELLKEKAARGKSTTSLNSMLDGFMFSPTVVGGNSSPRSGRFTGPSPDLSSSLRNPVLFAEGNEKSEHDTPRHAGKTWCGISVGVWIVLLAVAIALVALAIILPITLVVVPKDKNHSTSITHCESTMPCNNGGASVLDKNGNCQCICTDNFTGSDCSTPNTQGCSIILTTTLYNATIGSKLTPLVYNSELNYNIMLNASALLPIFSANNLNCDSQNGLIALSALSTRSQAHASFEGRDSVTGEIPLPSVIGRQVAATSEGVVFDGSSATPTASSSSAATATTSSSSSPSSSQGFDASSERTLDFMRTAILYLVQTDNDLSSGIVAQSDSQQFLNQPSGSPKNISIGGDWTANLVDYVLNSVSGGAVGETGA